MASPAKPPRAPGQDHDLAVLLERDRIATQLQNEVIQRIFAIGLTLQSAAAKTADPLMRRQIEKAIDDIDDVVKTIRDTVFGLHDRLKDRGFRAGIVQLCDQYSLAPEITFRGPADGALHPATSAQLLDTLHDALGVIRQHWAPVLIDVTANGGTHATVIQAVPLPAATQAREPERQFPGLQARAAQAGIRLVIHPGPDSTRFTWHAPQPDTSR
jgi:two-component system, NarL family, sensor histidine kinase DevS